MPWAIFSDFSGVTETSDMGIHATEEAALEACVLYLESNKTEIVDKIAKAKRRLRSIRRKK